MISLLDVTVTGISVLPARFLEDVALHGLVVSTGELKRVHNNAFTALARPLQALGLPNNLLDSVPTAALSHLVGLDRLDLSHNKLKMLEADSFKVSITKNPRNETFDRGNAQVFENNFEKHIAN